MAGTPAMSPLVSWSAALMLYQPAVGTVTLPMSGPVVSAVNPVSTRGALLK
jgi:hypothetical protein